MSELSEGDPNPFDITVVVKDGKEFQAHRNVLSQASPFFEKLLSTDMKENSEGVIRLEWIIESQMADILQFIYTGNVQITTQGNAEKLIETADYLLLSNLKTVAGKFLEQHITIENCISVYLLAEQYSCQDLFISTRKFINSNFTIVAATDEFLNLPSCEVEKWISSDDIVIDAEEIVFETIVRWIDHDKSERSGKFGKLFRHVRLTTISRDILLSDVMTNDLVQENKDSLDSVTGALHWYDRSNDCKVPRPHFPRKALEKDVMVITNRFGKVHPCFYLPATDEWFRLPPAVDGERGRVKPIEHIVSYGGRLFAVTSDIALSQCYNPDLNLWYAAPWTKLDLKLPLHADAYGEYHFSKVLVVKNKICFMAADDGSITLWTYNFDSNSFTSLFNWVREKVSFCAVAAEKYIYVLGGSDRGDHRKRDALSECTRFDAEAHTWQKIAPLNVARRNACGASQNEKMFIAGGCCVAYRHEVKLLNRCEVYTIPTDQWQVIANLTLNRNLGSMVLVDDTPYVLGGHTSFGYYGGHTWSDNIECYDHERNEWNNQAVIPVNKLKVNSVESELELMLDRRDPYYFKACSLRVLKRALNHLESVDCDLNEPNQQEHSLLGHVRQRARFLTTEGF